MTLALNIHHIRFAVKSIEKFCQLLKVQLQFHPYAYRCEISDSNSNETVVFKHQGAVFIIDKRDNGSTTNGNETFCWSNRAYPVDTVCDVCLQCSDIENILERALSMDKNSVKIPLAVLHDGHNGTVKYAVIKPPIGNVQHTLVDLSEYNGPFLPGFKLIDNSNLNNRLPVALTMADLIQTVDHVAFAVKIGQTDSIMDWYNHCMGFNRLIINVDEDESEGFVVQEGVQGLRLKAMFGPLTKLSECDAPLHEIPHKIPKFVFCEALSDNFEADQVSHFMHMHCGSGVQHIAFATKDIVETVSSFKQKGLSCVLPPDSYYSERTKDIEIQQLNYDMETLRTNNILVESHLSLSDSTSSSLPIPINSIDVEDQRKNMNNTQWFIMQVFTSPVFQEKTLFFEIIQRFQTISGFGAGNIGALWRAVQKELFNK